jgi:hypothetical protein
MTGLRNQRSENLPLNTLVVLQDFASSLESDKNYDLFCCLVRIVLKSDEEAAPIIADLMRTSNTELEILSDNTFSGIGSYFDNFIKKQRLHSRFKELSEHEAGQ